MLASSDRVRDYARVALAGIRIFNAAMALAAPKFLIDRLGLDPRANVGMVYPFRMFGIRTLIIGLELLQPDGEIRRHAQRMAVFIHGSDAVSALIARMTGQLPARQGTITVIISTTNFVLALLARPRK